MQPTTGHRREMSVQSLSVALSLPLLFLLSFPLFLPFPLQFITLVSREKWNLPVWTYLSSLHYQENTLPTILCSNRLQQITIFMGYDKGNVVSVFRIGGCVFWSRWRRGGQYCYSWWIMKGVSFWNKTWFIRNLEQLTKVLENQG